MKTLTKQSWLTYAALAYGLLLAIVLVEKFLTDFLFDPTDDWWRFIYLFTYQTNIMVATWSLCYGIGNLFQLKKLLDFILKKIVIIIITVNTLIVFFIVFFVLDPVFQGEWQPLSSLSELLNHNLSTVFMVIYFFAVPGIGKLKNVDAVTVLIYPFVYFIIHTIVGSTVEFKPGGDEFGPAFNYDFINPSNYENIMTFVVIFIALVAIFGALGFGLIKLKQRVGLKQINT
jgi:hypothetical protein